MSNEPLPQHDKKDEHHLPHIEVNHIDEKKKKSLGNRILVAVVLFVTAIPCAVLGSWFWFAYISFFLCVAIYEIVKAPQKKYRWYIWVFTYIITISYAMWFLIKFNISSYLEYKRSVAMDANLSWTPSLENYFSYLAVSVYGMVGAFGFYALAAILHEDFDWRDVAYFFTMTFVVGIGFQGLYFIRFYPLAVNWGAAVDTSKPIFKYWGTLVFFVYVVATTFLNDTWAYFCGMLFGKHHINPRISPNKTYEGFYGGMILSALSGIGIAMICEACGYPILPGFTCFGSDSRWYLVVILSITIPLVGNLGDFTFSLIKRFYGFKDYSHLLGAHGGVLDRIDSLTFTAIYASMFAVFSATGWNFFQ